MDDEIKYMSPAQLAKRWAISTSSIYQLKCGTDRLTRVYLNRATLRFLKSEIEAFEIDLFKQASRYNASSLAA